MDTNKFQIQTERYAKLREMANSVDMDGVSDHLFDELFSYLHSKFLWEALLSKYSWNDVYDEPIEGWQQGPVE